MKHTLQSLLMTTVLTLPTVFGSELDATAMSADTTTAKPSSKVEASCRALTQIGRPAALAREYLNSLTKDSTQDDVDFVADKLEQLGYPGLAIKAYELSMSLPNTQIYSNTASTQIARLQKLPATRPQSALGRLNTDVLEEIIGSVYNNGEKISLGFVGLREFRALGSITI